MCVVARLNAMLDSVLDLVVGYRQGETAGVYGLV